MAIDINNANFKMFTDFAATAKLKARAQLESNVLVNGQGEARAIKASNNFDFIGNIGRIGRYKTANDTVRTLFRETVASMFGGEENIPENVMEAMKLHDFGKGKPLTARRIIAVKTEVERFAQAAKAAGDKAVAGLKEFSVFTNLPKAEADAVEKAVREILETCKNDDVLEVIGGLVDKLCISGDGKMRSVAQIKAKADAIKANFEEIKAAANGNNQILRAGKFMMKALTGKSLPKGQIGKLVQFATGNAVQLDVIKRLKADTGPVTINRALIQMEKNIKAALDAAGMKFDAFDNEVKNPARDFIERVMLQRLSKSNLRAIHQALNGESAVQLNTLENTLDTRWIAEIPIEKEVFQETIMGDRNKPIPREVKDEVQNVASSLLSHGLSTTSAIISEILVEDAPNPPLDKDPVLPGNTMMIIADLKDVAFENIAERHKARYLNGIVSGESKGADLVRKVFSDKIGAWKDDSGDKLNAEINANMKTMLNMSIANDCKKFAAGNFVNSSFGKDIARQLDVKLPGGIKLKNNLNEARDQIASFVTKGAKDAYDKLTEREKGKVHVVMASLSQETEKNAFFVPSFTIHPKGSEDAFVGVGDESNNIDSYTLSMDDEGGVEISYTGMHLTSMLVNAKVDQPVGEGSKLESKFTLKMTAEDLDHMASLDYSKFDAEEITEIFNTNNLPNKLPKIGERFPEGFKFPETTTCTTSYNATIN